MKTDRMQLHLIIIAVVLIVAAIAVSVIYSGCASGKKYKVDYNGQKSSFTNAKDLYSEGEDVEIYYSFIATDTDYSFYVDGEKINPLYEDSKGYVIKFKMPAHDVSVKVASKNSMIEDPDGPHEETMLIDYYTAVTGTDGYDSSREMVLYDYSDTEVKLSVFVNEADSDETRTDYIVPREALNECKEVIKRNKFDTWNKKYDDSAIDGGATIVKYLNDKNEVVRVSTDHMPDDGERKMGEIASVLYKYVQEKYKMK